MCGIVGIIDWKNSFAEETRQVTVRAMNQAIFHRGPDESGFFSQKNTSLAMRRLSIIDEAGGTQPIFNEAQNICVFFNGEIYNYQFLKESLQELGHQFATNSDTEVLVHLYEEYGKAMLQKLKGMFAFCIYDLSKNEYFLARDRFGEKPLYYHWDKKTFSFASEIKALLENKRIERKLNRAALPYYFRTSLVPEPLTLLENVQSLPAGHYIFMAENHFETQAYFQANYEKKIKLTSEAEAIEYLTPYLENAVHRQTVSDVPIGAFLSGGIDSSSVVALLQKNSTQKIKTFNVRFEDQAFDESAIARKVAEHCGTEHHELFVPNVDFDESIFWKIVDHVGLPFRDSSAIPSYLVTQEISQHVKVALSGDGGDELFGGYDLFQWYQKIIDFKKVPLRSVAHGGLALAQKIPLLNKYSFLRKAKRGIGTSLLEEDEIPIALNEMFLQKEVEQLLGEGFHNRSDSQPNNTFTNEKSYPLLKNYPTGFSTWSPLRKVMYYRLQHTLPANMLIKIDRMSMANSLEVRAPFLDVELFEASVQVPDNLLVKDGKGKYILRQIMKKHLPDEVFNHPKMGFSIPLSKYQNEAFKQLAKRLLFDENPLPDLIPLKELSHIYNRGISLKKDTAQVSVFQAAHHLWMMMMLFGWIKRFEIKN